MKIKITRTKVEEDELFLRKMMYAASMKSIEAGMRNKRYTYPIDLAIMALSYEHALVAKTKRRSKFLKWMEDNQTFTNHLKKKIKATKRKEKK